MLVDLPDEMIKVISNYSVKHGCSLGKSLSQAIALLHILDCEESANNSLAVISSDDTIIKKIVV